MWSAIQVVIYTLYKYITSAITSCILNIFGIFYQKSNTHLGTISDHFRTKLCNSKQFQFLANNHRLTVVIMVKSQEWSIIWEWCNLADWGAEYDYWQKYPHVKLQCEYLQIELYWSKVLSSSLHYYHPSKQIQQYIK